MARRDAGRRRLEQTAYHEAGHAVAQALLPHVAKLRKVSIVPDEKAGNLGSAHSHGEPSFRPDVEADLRKVVDEIVVLLAGSVAEKRFAGRANHIGARSDYNAAIDLASYVTGSDSEEINELLRWLRKRAEGFVARHWKSICTVAGALLDKHTLSGREVHYWIDVATLGREKADRHATMFAEMRARFRAARREGPRPTVRA